MVDKRLTKTDERRFGGGDESRVQALMAENERLRMALERIAESHDVDVNGEYVIRGVPRDGYEARSIAKWALDA